MKIGKHVAVDSMILIYLIEENPDFFQSAKHKLETASQLTLSTLGLGEILAGFEKKADLKGKLQFLSFLESYKKLSIVGFGKQEALIFAQLRAKYPQVKPPDTMHLATAISARADAFLTNDKNLKCIEEIPVVVLA